MDEWINGQTDGSMDGPMDVEMNVREGQIDS